MSAYGPGLLSLLMVSLLTAAVDDPVLTLPNPVRVRPGETTTVAYQLSNWSGAHSIEIAAPLLPVTTSASVTNRTCSVTAAAGTNRASGNLIVSARDPATLSIIASRAVTLTIDPRPRLSVTGLSLTIAEDDPSTRDVLFLDDAASMPLLSYVVTGSASQLTATHIPTPLVLGQCRINLQSAANYFGPSSARITVRDEFSDDPTHFDIPVTVTATNDPPDVALTTLLTPTMHPDAGTPVAMLERIAITPGVDITGVNLTATVGATTTRLSWLAEIVGTAGHPSLPGCDVLALRGDAGYRIDAATISVLPAGTTIADWSRPDGRSDRIQVTLRAGGTQAQVEEIARLLHYAYLQSPAAAFTRTLRVTVSEPDPAGGVDPSAPVSCPIQVAAVNRPPVVTLSPLTVEPMGAASLPILLADADGLDNLTVRVVAPLPGGGRIEPLECSGTQAVAGVLRYTHTASDISDDRVTIAVSDASETVIATTTVAIRTTPDRISIVSDPLFALERGSPASLTLQAVPAGCVFTLEAYGHPLPPCPAGVAIVGGELRFDWTTIPGNTAWIALAVKATNTPSGFAPAVQRMLIRVLPPAPVASTP